MCKCCRSTRRKQSGATRPWGATWRQGSKAGRGKLESLARLHTKAKTLSMLSVSTSRRICQLRRCITTMCFIPTSFGPTILAATTVCQAEDICTCGTRRWPNEDPQRLLLVSTTSCRHTGLEQSLVSYSDGCGSQNKNLTIVGLYSELHRTGVFDVIWFDYGLRVEIIKDTMYVGVLPEFTPTFFIKTDFLNFPSQTLFWTSHTGGYSLSLYNLCNKIFGRWRELFEIPESICSKIFRTKFHPKAALWLILPTPIAQ